MLDYSIIAPLVPFISAEFYSWTDRGCDIGCWDQFRNSCQFQFPSQMEMRHFVHCSSNWFHLFCPSKNCQFYTCSSKWHTFAVLRIILPILKLPWEVVSFLRVDATIWFGHVEFPNI
jgi:hypothetical protein